MRLSQIPVGHIGRNGSTMVLRTKDHGVFIGEYTDGSMHPVGGFIENYEDMGELKISLVKVETYKIEVSVVK